MYQWLLYYKKSDFQVIFLLYQFGRMPIYFVVYNVDTLYKRVHEHDEYSCWILNRIINFGNETAPSDIILCPHTIFHLTVYLIEIYLKPKIKMRSISLEVNINWL